ncbi:hypothetical protein D9C73_009382 [Collichthys lucidus]|uniref:Uncharacterized protein n=1 Tax=Collichthys lucidus TaxID=240159 RepID=A0A4U5UNB3_COLLU|nr:hypothetical protein D9C73_009382 [Collichthys lucidus]
MTHFSQLGLAGWLAGWQGVLSHADLNNWDCKVNVRRIVKDGSFPPPPASNVASVPGSVSWLHTSESQHQCCPRVALSHGLSPVPAADPSQLTSGEMADQDGSDASPPESQDILSSRWRTPVADVLLSTRRNAPSADVTVHLHAQCRMEVMHTQLLGYFQCPCVSVKSQQDMNGKVTNGNLPYIPVQSWHVKQLMAL